MFTPSLSCVHSAAVLCSLCRCFVFTLPLSCVLSTAVLCSPYSIANATLASCLGGKEVNTAGVRCSSCLGGKEVNTAGERCSSCLGGKEVNTAGERCSSCLQVLSVLTVGGHVRNKPRPMRERGSILLYIHGNQKAREDGQPRTATLTHTQLLNSDALLLHCCFTSTEARWLIRDVSATRLRITL